jgi:hypothetical protein
MSENLITDIDAVGELAAKNAEMCLGAIHIDLMLSRQLQPIFDRAVGLSFHYQWPHSTTLGDDVGESQWSIENQALVDIVEYELAVLVRDLGERRFHSGIGGADTGAHAHRDDKKQASIIGEESHDALMRSDLGHDQMNSLGKHMMMLGLFAGQHIVLVHKWAGGVDQHLGADFPSPDRSSHPAREPPKCCLHGAHRVIPCSWRQCSRDPSPSARIETRTVNHCRAGKHPNTRSRLLRFRF